MKTLCLVLLVSLFTSLQAQDLELPKDLHNKMEGAFDFDYRLNRASKNETGYYIEAISAGKIYTVTADLKGTILSKELVFTIPTETLKMLSEKCSDYKVEDVRKTENATQLEVICNKERLAFNISKEGRVTEEK